MDRSNCNQCQNLSAVYYDDQATIAGLRQSHHLLRTTAVPSNQYCHQLQQPLWSDAQRFRSALAVLAASSSSSSPPDTPSSSSLSPSSLIDVQVLSKSRQHRHLDRSASEPFSTATVLLEQAADGMGSGSAAFCRYKTELCRPFEENGACKYADKCQFAHGRAELRPIVRHPKYKTDLCRTYHTTGLCPYGPRCHFIHNDEERRLSEMNRMALEGQQQQRTAMMQQQPSTTSVQHQEMALAAALIAHHRCLTAVPTPSQRHHQQHVEQAIASSLQRSLSLGGPAGRTVASGPRGEFRLNTTSASDFSGCGRGSVDSMISIGSSPSPTAYSSPLSSASTSDVESTGDRRHERSQRHFSSSYPPSTETAIMLALMARRLRDGGDIHQHPNVQDDEVKAVLARLLQSAAVTTTST